MTADVEIHNDLLEAYSRGEITRHDIEDRIGEPLGFAGLLMRLHARGLPLPRFPSDPNSPGVELVRRLAEAASRGR